MSIKDKFQEYVYKQDRKLSQQDTASRYRLRNRKYHGYFEGYTEYTVMKPNGKQKIVRVYTAEYYRQTLSTGKAAALRLTYVLLFLLAGYLLFSGSTDINAGCNYVWYVTIWQACCIACLFWILTILCSYVPSKFTWKIHDYKVCHYSLLKAALAAAASFAVSVGAITVYMVLNGTMDSMHVALRAVLGAAAALAIHCLENRMEYEKKDNPVQKQYSGGVEIK